MCLKMVPLFGRLIYTFFNKGSNLANEAKLMNVADYLNINQSIIR